MPKAKYARKASPGECVICVEKGVLPSQAIACALHSLVTIDELRAEIAVLKNHAGASSRLHLALAEMASQVPSKDGSEELDYVCSLQERLDRVEALLQHAHSVASYDADVVSMPPKLLARGGTSRRLATPKRTKESKP